MARKSKKTADTKTLFEKAYKLVKSGSTTKEACKKAGIPLPTYYYNLRKVEGGKATPRSARQPKQASVSRLPKDAALLMIIPLAKAKSIVNAIARAARPA